MSAVHENSVYPRRLVIVPMAIVVVDVCYGRNKRDTPRNESLNSFEGIFKALKELNALPQNYFLEFLYMGSVKE